MSAGQGASASDSTREASLAAVLVATIMIAQQVASRALRDGFFLTYFDASALPSVMTSASLLSIVIAPSTASTSTEHFSPVTDTLPRISATLTGR